MIHNETLKLYDLSTESNFDIFVFEISCPWLIRIVHKHMVFPNGIFNSQSDSHHRLRT